MIIDHPGMGQTISVLQTYLSCIQSCHEIKISDHLRGQRPTTAEGTFLKGQVNRGARQFYPTKPSKIQTRCLGPRLWGRLFHGKIGGQWSVEILSAAGSNDQPSVCFASRAAFVSYLVQILVCPSRISYRGCVFHTCVPGNNSFALLIMMLVQEERRSSAMVSPPLPIMWPDTLLGDDDTVRLSLHIGGVGTLGLASSGVCPCPLQDASLHCFHCPSHCRGGNTALP